MLFETSWIDLRVLREFKNRTWVKKADEKGGII